MSVEAATESNPIELSGAAFHHDPYPVYARLRAHGEPFFNEATGSWLVSRFADVEALLRDPRISKKLERASPTPFERSILFRDPPDAPRIRTQLNQAFSAVMAGDIEARIAVVANELIDRFERGTTFDFIQEFALPLPVVVITELLGTPREDRERLHHWSAAFIVEEGVLGAEIVARQLAAISALEEYFGTLVDGANGVAAEGFIGALLRAEPKDRLSRDELICNCILLLLAGHETTVNLLGNGLYLLLEDAERFARIKREPGLLPAAIEEMLRLESPVQLGTFRVITEAIEVGGRTLKEGSSVTLVLGAANRDPEAFAEPDSFDMTRTQNRHLGFGNGPHRCIGAWLARTEARIGFTLLMERMPQLRLADGPGAEGWVGRIKAWVGMERKTPPAAPKWRQLTMIRGLKELRVSV